MLACAFEPFFAYFHVYMNLFRLLKYVRVALVHLNTDFTLYKFR
jgi:hypothetical protein